MTSDANMPMPELAGASEATSGVLRPEPSAVPPGAFQVVLLKRRLSSMLAAAEGCPKASGEGPAVKVVTLGGAYSCRGKLACLRSRGTPCSNRTRAVARLLAVSTRP